MRPLRVEQVRRMTWTQEERRELLDHFWMLRVKDMKDLLKTRPRRVRERMEPFMLPPALEDVIHQLSQYDDHCHD